MSKYRYDYESMSKEEVIALLRKKNAGNVHKIGISLTNTEYEILMNEILPAFECKNGSQFLKKIIRSEIILSKKEEQKNE